MVFFVLLTLLGQSAHKVDVNKADLYTLLENLPLDSVKVVKIYRYREAYGSFENMYDLASLPFITPEDIKILKDKAMFSTDGKDVYFPYYAEEIRERAVTEESPQESAYDYWLSALTTPINVNKASIDEIYSIYGVSLIDAVQVYKRAKMIGFLRASHLRRSPGLSYYGYRNMLPYVGFKDPEPVPFVGWVTVNFSHYSELYREETSNIEERLEELSTIYDTTSSLWPNLKESGWTQQDSVWLYNQLVQEREESQKLKAKPYLRVKFNGLLWGKVRTGISFYDNPYLSSIEPKYFASVEKLSLPLGFNLNKAILGYYRITLGQGLFLDNSDEGRARLMERVFGIFGDLSRYDEFAFYGGAFEAANGPVTFSMWHSYAPRNGIEDKDGNLLFYYDSDFIPSAFKDKFYEKVQGFNARVDVLPRVPGTQIGFSGMRIQYSRPMTADFSFMDIPLDRESFSDPVFNWKGGTEKKFAQLTGRTVLYPFSFEFEYAKEIGGGDAFVAKSRIQHNIFNLTVLYRDYDVDYTNPYSRSFYEDSRFRYTILTRSYRLIDPMYAEIGNLPFPKPEQGVYLESRYQPFARLLFPRLYLDLWRDKSDLQNNMRGQFQVEYRIVNQFRIRYTYRHQRKANLRYLGVSENQLNENSLQLIIPFGGTYLTAEYRNSVMKLTERGIDFRTSIYGSFLSFYVDRDVMKGLSVKAGAVVWATNGYSLWHFEDTGIDFLYGDGTKWFLTLVERVSPQLGVRLKLKNKITQYPHTGLTGHGVVTPDGEELYLPFVDEDGLFNLQLSLDYAF